MFFPVEPDLSNFCGEPEPAPGARVVFSAEQWREARRRAGHPAPEEVPWAIGFHVYERARDSLRWPCRLWRVEDVDEQRDRREGGWYFRCRALTVVEEVPPWWALGPHGERVAELIEQARALTPRQVAFIAAMDGAAERELHGRGVPADMGNCGVHVNRAFHEVTDRVGDELRTWDPDLQVLVLSDPAWLQARQAVQSAARAVAAPEAYTAAEREVLARRWDARGAAHT